MREAEEFAQLIKENKCNKAKQLIDDIYKFNSKKYADALVTVILVKANNALQIAFKGYYIPEETLLECTDISAVITVMCSAVRGSVKENREIIVEKAVNYIEANLSDSFLCAGGVADFVGTSSVKLSRMFEERLGITPLAYITKKRIDKSLDLLKTTASVCSIAEMCGFSSSEAYIRAFKRVYEKTPGKYREMR